MPGGEEAWKEEVFEGVTARQPACSWEQAPGVL